MNDFQLLVIAIVILIISIYNIGFSPLAVSFQYVMASNCGCTCQMEVCNNYKFAVLSNIIIVVIVIFLSIILGDKK